MHARAERFLGTPHNLDEGHAVWVRHRDLLHVLAGDEVVCGPSQLGLLHAITFDLLRAPVRAGSVQAVSRGEALELTVDGPEGPRAVRVSSPDKVYFPERGITKRQVVEYYRAVAEPLLRAVGQRPTTLKRFPDGVAGEPFYAKRVPKGAPAG